jgi:uracil-DNA glycosylase
MSVANLTKEKYANVERWYDFYEHGGHIGQIPYHGTWTIMFAHLAIDPKFNKIDKKIKEIVQKNKHLRIYPLPSYLFKAFVVTPATDLKVVFIGQDPYFNCEVHNNKYVPQAMGLSFSVPDGIAIPSSLDNIYQNMVKYNHIKEKPKSGNLWYWAAQGCLMLNTALTVEHGCKESHARLWEWFTDYIIQYISDYMNGIVFVMWGAYALKKNKLIDLKKHKTIVSSHPSGLSANKPFQNYPAFMNEDHFGKINTMMEESGRSKILWN